ncbi:MAG: peptidoglycan editing factor PgeF [Gammaproteobacteria bacterium]|nr:peptidoglycan editing factor PgeF [Gammaproteobacteria bacterium]MCF6229907.1 peptidoglycan editing factor PgeF [Gammaproteobacteria bacterium]
MGLASSFIIPDWPAPECVRAVSTTRQGGGSQPPYATFNLATHVGDDPQQVVENRDHLQKQLNFPSSPAWMRQVHGIDIHTLADPPLASLQGDGAVSFKAGLVCAVMTADCLPVLLCDRSGQVVAAIHAGWRGLCSGVIERCIQQMQRPGDQLLAWLGPAIGPDAFQVGAEVLDRFVAHDQAAVKAFVRQDESHWLADIYQLARLRLLSQGVTAIYGGQYCTFQQNDLFFSYRREGETGRMASLIWLQ